MKLNRRVTIITRFSGIMFSLLLLGGLAACSDDNNGSDTPEPEPSTYPTTPFSKIELKEVIESDAQPVTATHTYLYNSAGRLTSYTGKQSFTAGDELFEIENTTTVEYKDHQAVITDEAGTVSTYTLNDKGYATTCTSQDMAGNTRTYTFSYLINTEDKYYLENITEKLDDGKEYSFITIDYSNFRALRIQQKVDTFEHNSTATTPSDNEIANISEIPSLFITDMYPLSMHAVAIYGKILGEPANYLITQLIPDSNGESEETTTYTYTLDNRGYRHFLPCSRQAYKERLRAGLHTHRELYHRIISYLLLKELVEEKDVIVYGVVPIRSGMSTGTGDEVMVYLPCQQPVVQVLVHFKKEIGLTAVDD